MPTWHSRFMELPSRADYPLANADALTLDPAFWPLHLHWAHDIQTLASMLEVDGGDLDVMAEQLEDTERWPAFPTPLTDGGQFVVIYRNFRDDAGIDLERHDADSAVAHLASIEGDWPARVLEWDDLIEIATTAPRAPGVTDPIKRFLLLLPFLASAPHDAAECVRDRFRPRSRSDSTLAEMTELIMAESPCWAGTA